MLTLRMRSKIWNDDGEQELVMVVDKNLDSQNQDGRLDKIVKQHQDRF